MMITFQLTRSIPVNVAVNSFVSQDFEVLFEKFDRFTSTSYLTLESLLIGSFAKFPEFPHLAEMKNSEKSDR